MLQLFSTPDFDRHTPARSVEPCVANDLTEGQISAEPITSHLREVGQVSGLTATWRHSNCGVFTGVGGRGEGEDTSASCAAARQRG